jgi:hypothetical protein
VVCNEYLLPGIYLMPFDLVSYITDAQYAAIVAIRSLRWHFHNVLASVDVLEPATRSEESPHMPRVC